jgi:hypothetical protein
VWRGTPVTDEILSDIAALAKWEAGPGAVFLYAEADTAFMAPSLFKDRGDVILSYMPSEELIERLFDCWEAASDDRKWAALFLTIEGDHFDARFQYPDEMVPGEYTGERETRALRAQFGDKPIDCSHWPKFQRY